MDAAYLGGLIAGIWAQIGSPRAFQGPTKPPKGASGARTGPNIGFWLFSPAGWFHMGQNGAVRSGHTVALLWTPHMPIFRRKFYGPPKGPPGAKTSPSRGPRSTNRGPRAHDTHVTHPVGLISDSLD